MKLFSREDIIELLQQLNEKQADELEGKLTEQWCKGHKDLISGGNSAGSLLKKIKAGKIGRLD